VVASVGVRFAAMACDCEVHLAVPDEAQARTLAQPAIDEVLRIEARYSRYRADSIVSRINAAAGAAPVAVDPETEALLRYADTLHASSDGLFDITSGILRRAWNFREARLPAPDELQLLLGLVGWDKVQLHGGTIHLEQAGMELDFGGFGKEYAADRAAAILQAAGVQHGYVNLGGDIRILGPHPDGTPWHIAIQNPRDAGATVASMPVTQGALATSGDYERFFELDGRRYCHVLNPRTGMPVDVWRSISVLAPTATAAGSYATIAMLKEKAGLAFLRESGLAFLAIDSDGQVFSS
jgi:thiamine biosynthesis lipoprotein